MSLNIDMKMARPVNFSGVTLNLNSNSCTLWLSCNVVNPGKIFHSNSTGSPSILSKALSSVWTFEPRQSVFPCNIWLRVLVHLSKTQDTIWEFVGLVVCKRLTTCSSPIKDNCFHEESSQFYCFHSIDLIWLFGYQLSQVCRNICFIVRSFSVFLMECQLSE